MHCSWSVLCASPGGASATSLYSRSSLGLDSLIRFLILFLGALSLERGVLSCLAIYPRVCFQNDSLSRLRCSGVASIYGWVTILLYCLWLNEHIHYFLTPRGNVKRTGRKMEMPLEARKLSGRGGEGR